MSDVPGSVHRALDRDWAFGLGRNLLTELASRSECRVTVLLSREALMPPCSPNEAGNMKTMFTRTILRGGVLATVAALSISSGPGLFAEPDMSVTPFKYEAPRSALEDLKQRLRQTRWPERETVNDWSQGVPLARLRELVEYWSRDYDWRRCEAKLYSFPQFRTRIDGLNIHFLHVRSPHKEALPIIITHGWPGSVIEFLKVIDPLTNPTAQSGRAEDAFQVVVPSLPGFGFSDKPNERGWNAPRIARAWSELMRRLGYTRYVAQGGDWGSLITTTLAQHRPAGLAGIHLNMPFVFPDPIPTTGLSAAEQRAP